MLEVNSFQSDSKFWATDFFPKGIGRSGHFTKEQAILLENHGKAYQALNDGSLKPRNDEEMEFLRVFKGEKPATTKHEKTWKRFLDVTDQKHRVHYSVSSSSAPDVDFSASEGVDDL